MGPPQRRPPPRKAGSTNSSKEGKKKQEKQRQNQARTEGGPRGGQQTQRQRLESSEEIDLSTTIPVSLQQLLLNVFKGGLAGSSSCGIRSSVRREDDAPSEAEPREGRNKTREGNEEEELDIKTLIQTLKSHLYNRDFESAFADANEDLLRAYALRWSASRALGYAGIFRAVVGSRFLPFKSLVKEEKYGRDAEMKRRNNAHILCIGGGAGAEIVALAGAWRDLMDEERVSMKTEQGKERDDADEGDEDARSVSGAVGEITLEEDSGKTSSSILPNISITAVDIADWSTVVDRLSAAIKSSTIPGSKAHPAPLLPALNPHNNGQDAGGRFSISFQKSDVLSLSDDELRNLLHPAEPKTSPGPPTTPPEKIKTALVTLMFTLNELFSTSMAKTTAFLLRLTDLLDPGTVLLVVDSPGSYSTVTLGKSKSSSPSSTETPEPDTASSEPEKPQQRNYPMKFLLDHALLSVAVGKWEKILSQDSRWFRRDAAKLRYAVGEGAGLEDMRFQIHVYRRLEG